MYALGEWRDLLARPALLATPPQADSRLIYAAKTNVLCT